VFVAVAVTVGWLVDIAALRAYEAQRSRIEATTLARSAATLAADPDPLPGLIEQVRQTFELDRVRLVPRSSSDGAYDTASGAVDRNPDTSMPVGNAATDGRYDLELYGGPLTGDDERVLRALADQLAVAIERSELGREAAEAEELTEVDALRTALLRAVSHDLRTPLASIKAMASGLLHSDDVHWRPEQVRDALTTIDEETDRLNRLVGNLLDASRLQIGLLALNLRDVDVAEVVAATLDSIGDSADRVQVQLPEGLPPARCDPALFEQSLYNVVINALRHAQQTPVRVTAGVVEQQIHVCTIDRGPGIPRELRAKVMSPFQQLGDSRSANGVGLGLSIAQGFVHSMNGTLSLEDTPGGGLTVIIALPIATESDTR
jgi:two-component system sensor histidine kinase KdpD